MARSTWGSGAEGEARWYYLATQPRQWGARATDAGYIYTAPDAIARVDAALWSDPTRSWLTSAHPMQNTLPDAGSREFFWLQQLTGGVRTVGAWAYVSMQRARELLSALRMQPDATWTVWRHWDSTWLG